MWKPVSGAPSRSNPSRKLSPDMRLFLLLLALSSSASAIAEKVYVRDTLYVPLRGGQSSEHRILHRGLRSGTELERLETNEESGYSRVRTEDGLEGWLQTQYLVEEPIASMQLDGMQDRLASLEAEHQQTLLRLREAREENERLSSSQGNLSAEKDELAKELAQLTELSANTIAIDQENQQLNEDRETLLEEIARLNSENADLSDDDAQDWFLRGAGTVLLGLLFGVWIGRRIYQRRNNSGWA